jgi:hypothetical protein
MRRHGLRRDLASCCSDRLTQKVKQSWPRSILQPYTSLRTRKQRYTAMEKTVHHNTHTRCSFIRHSHDKPNPNPNQIQITQIEGQCQPKISSCMPRSRLTAEHTAQHSTDTLRNPLPHRQVRALERAYTHTHTAHI